MSFMEDRASRTSCWRPQAIGRLLDQARTGDVIITAELSYLTRTTLYAGIQ